ALNLATKEEVATITNMAFAVNEAMKAFFKELKIDLIDFKLEFGRFHDQIVLADEISPDTCRFWEADTWDTTKHVSLDKDRFRRDLGGVEDAYAEIFKRLGIK
ncbi:MAG: phosphoribosylaminoimidazolesuccinocarboxamide synthase, partial [Candidatus Coproplasma sp.]